MSSTLPAVIFEAFRRHGDALALGRRSATEEQPTSFRQLGAEIRRVALGLHALGIERGDRVALFSDNRREWLIGNLALAGLGSVDVPRACDAPLDELIFILRHSGAKALLVENPRLLTRLRDKTDLSQIDPIVLLSGEASGTIAMSQVLARGLELEEEDGGAFERLSSCVEAEDLLTIVYTSGTTANPKGVRLTHANLVANLGQLDRFLTHHAREGRVLSILPPWHMFERTIEYFVLMRGLELWYSSVKTLRADLTSLQPTVFPSVPRIWESIYAGVMDKVRKLPAGKRSLFRIGSSLGRRCARWNDRAGRVTTRSRWIQGFLQRVVFKDLLAATGGRIELAVSGGGTLPAHIDEFFLGAGLNIVNGYGLTETSPILTARDPRANSPGTIGHLMSETETRIRKEDRSEAQTGEIGRLFVRGPQVMQGYHDNPEATSAVLDEESWFDTGDLVLRRPDGQFIHRGRAKETIVLRSGENVEPVDIETRLLQSPLIEQAMVVGQDAKVLGALVVANQESCREILGRDPEAGEDGICSDPDWRDLIQDEIQRLAGARSGLPGHMRVQAFCLLEEEFSAENGLLTQTLKMKRPVIAQHYGEAIEAILDRS